MKRRALRLLDRRYKKVLFVLLAGLLGAALGFSAWCLQSNRSTPLGLWQKQPRPPVRLTHFAAATPMSYIQGLYAGAADGTLYALLCDEYHMHCAWSSQDVLPSPPQGSWEGCCPEGLEAPDGSVAKPRAPGPVVDTYAVRYCRGDNSYLDYHYVMLEDGSIWLWRSGRVLGSPDFSQLYLWTTCCSGACGLTLGLVVVVVAVKVAARRSRPTP
jgi:hypothetical protein